MKITVKNSLRAGFFLRVVVAIWNGFFGPSYGAEGDALAFHFRAAGYAKDLVLDEFVVGWIYSYVLGIFYSITTDSLFLGSLLSCAAWLLSALLLIKSMQILGVEKFNQAKAVLIYALLPSSVLFTSVTLRESYQGLFVNLAIYCALKLCSVNAFLYWFIMAGAIAGMGCLHGSLLAFGIIFFLVTIWLVSMRRGKLSTSIKIIVSASLIALLALPAVDFISTNAYSLEGGLLAASERYLEGTTSITSRANYRNDTDSFSTTNPIILLPTLLSQYLLEPLPWKMTSRVDVVIIFENFLRAWLIWTAVSNLPKIASYKKTVVIFLIVSYFITELIWSLGTSNWGTAMRHHLPGTGLLLISAFAFSSNRKYLIFPTPFPKGESFGKLI